VTIKTVMPITKSPFRANSLTLVYMDLLLDICKSTSIGASPAHGDSLESDHFLEHVLVHGKALHHFPGGKR